ncbi:hypothetical protein N7462_011666 [Penicillium macrosclerotiorum]|uniref:uncharacterized protein n=1 Tax=Penicillium macrosclerotiorum TaxID=303699 RepID=UPI002547A218|nr:uncharacterized protein N7462_011666 [Penicillium macrosclerotiorum]KAJ5662740.1 hypothetical protein N7462_011666 [Penicillium macrosclerotiorum]
MLRLIRVMKCQDNLAIISIYLDTPYCALGLNTPPANMHETSELPQDDVLSLLAPDIEAFYSHIPSFILHFSNLLSTAITDLRTIVSTNAELQLDAAADITAGASRNIPAPTRSKHHDRARARDRRVRTSMAPVAPLASQLTDRVATLRRVQLSELPAARREMAATAAAVLAARAMVLERTVMILERAKHGTLARATRAKAEHLATVAQGVEGKLEVMKLEIAASLYTPETTAALARYQQHLHDTRERLNERRGLAIRELKSYGDVEESETAGSEHIDSTAAGTLAQIARRYGMLAREVETVRMEIARLEK